MLRPIALHLLLEDGDELVANDLALALGIRHALETPKEKFRRVLVLQLDFEVPDKNLLHHARFASAQRLPARAELGAAQ